MCAQGVRYPVFGYLLCQHPREGRRCSCPTQTAPGDWRTLVARPAWRRLPSLAPLRSSRDPLRDPRIPGLCADCWSARQGRALCAGSYLRSRRLHDDPLHLQLRELLRCARATAPARDDATRAAGGTATDRRNLPRVRSRVRDEQPPTPLLHRRLPCDCVPTSPEGLRGVCARQLNGVLLAYKSVHVAVSREIGSVLRAYLAASTSYQPIAPTYYRGPCGIQPRVDG